MTSLAWYKRRGAAWRGTHGAAGPARRDKRATARPGIVNGAGVAGWAVGDVVGGVRTPVGAHVVVHQLRLEPVRALHGSKGARQRGSQCGRSISGMVAAREQRGRSINIMVAEPMCARWRGSCSISRMVAGRFGILCGLQRSEIFKLDGWVERD